MSRDSLDATVRFRGWQLRVPCADERFTFALADGLRRCLGEDSPPEYRIAQ
jgi:hypothetical protein